MRVAVETWAPEYGTSVEEAAVDPASAEVAIEVETAATDWAPRSPSGEIVRPAVIDFVDGVRRIDARVWVTGDRDTRPGLCATWAAGVVRCTAEPPVAELDRAEVRRGLFTPLPEAGPFVTRHGTYRLVPVTSDEPDQLSLALQGCMADLEHFVSVPGDDGRSPADLLVLDGPLRDRHRLPGAVGYVKTHHAAYLPESVQPVVSLLACGQRTPVFLIGGRWSRWSWYLRLPVEINYGWAGVVRCEASADLPLAQVVQLADRVTAVLPRFASAPQKDPRAPHNLYPIAGLERALRRRLGDPTVMFRSLQAAAVRAA